jgi:hypothetical protein
LQDALQRAAEPGRRGRLQADLDGVERVADWEAGVSLCWLT